MAHVPKIIKRGFQDKPRVLNLGDEGLHLERVRTSGALVLTLEVGKHMMKCILIDPGSVAGILYFPALLWLGYNHDNLYNPRRALVDFNIS